MFFNHKVHRESTEKIMKKSFNVGADPRVRPSHFPVPLWLRVRIPRFLCVFAPLREIFRNAHAKTRRKNGGSRGSRRRGRGDGAPF